MGYGPSSLELQDVSPSPPAAQTVSYLFVDGVLNCVGQNERYFARELSLTEPLRCSQGFLLRRVSVKKPARMTTQLDPMRETQGTAGSRAAGYHVARRASRLTFACKAGERDQSDAANFCPPSRRFSCSKDGRGGAAHAKPGHGRDRRGSGWRKLRRLCCAARSLCLLLALCWLAIYARDSRSPGAYRRSARESAASKSENG